MFLCQHDPKFDFVTKKRKKQENEPPRCEDTPPPQKIRERKSLTRQRFDQEKGKKIMLIASKEKSEEEKKSLSLSLSLVGARASKPKSHWCQESEKKEGEKISFRGCIFLMPPPIFSPSLYYTHKKKKNKSRLTVLNILQD